MSRRAVFLDKDGTLVPDIPYNVDPGKIALVEGCGEALRALRDAGFALVVVSNQSGVARGYFDEAAVKAVEARLRELLKAEGVTLDGFYACVHHPEGVHAEYAMVCDCRKPNPGLLLRAARELDLDLGRSWMAGDILDDCEAGQRAGCRSVLVDAGGETEWVPGPFRTPDEVAGSLAEAARLILAGSEPRHIEEGAMPAALAPLLDAFQGMHVLVIGEAMLDIYLDGPTGRLCREAPVPVVNLAKRTDVPGGAGNTAVNVAALGGRLAFVSVIGDDAEAETLIGALQRAAVPVHDLIVQPGRRTLAKHRVLADGQMVVRYDQGDTGAADEETEAAVIERLKDLWPATDAVIVSDYCYGVVTTRVLAALAELQAASARVLLVDSRHLERYRAVRPTVVKPNYEEVVGLLGGEAEAPDARVRRVAEHADELLELTGATMAAVTLDRDGVVLARDNGECVHILAPVTRHARVAGAGDTFGAALALALAAGCEPVSAAQLAEIAASVVVEKDGTASCSATELREHLTSDGKFIRDLGALAARLEVYRQQGRRIVFTNGCFDILHSGHITYLNRARDANDVLIVGLNSDASVRRLKGPERPINSLEDRARVLAALSCVDHVVPFEDDMPLELIRVVRPDLFVKGGDYTEERLPEAPLVRSLGGEVRILPFVEDRSTTSIIARIREIGPPGRERGQAQRSTAGGEPVLG